MKNVLVFSIIVFLLTTEASAEVKEGKSSVNTSVTTNVNSSSNNSNNSSETHTYIEIEVNGEKKVLDTKEPGTHTLSIEKDGGKSSATVKINGSAPNGSQNSKKDLDSQGASSSGGEAIDDSQAQEDTVRENKTFILEILDQVSKFFKNLFSFF